MLSVTWAFGPPMGMEIPVVLTPAQAGVQASPEEAGFPLSRE